jgi:U3 small nucleolar RNA-associated protein 12
MDISSDSTLLASGSADKNLKIWGLDFGDCHRSLFAHGDSLMAVVFQPNTHYVFTASESHKLSPPLIGLVKEERSPCRASD